MTRDTQTPKGSYWGSTVNWEKGHEDLEEDFGNKIIISHYKAYIFYLYQNTAEKKKKEQWVGEQ